METRIQGHLEHRYHVECWKPCLDCDACASGNPWGCRNKFRDWEDWIINLVTTEGKNTYLDRTLKGGFTGAPPWYVLLVKAKTTGYAVGDTLASHSGWTESVPGTDYTGNRQAWTPGTISGGSVDNSAAKAVFPILTTQTISGCGMSSVATGTSGLLLGVGDFTGGDKPVGNGDTLNVTVTCSFT